jgi:hypothetical protein
MPYVSSGSNRNIRGRKKKKKNGEVMVSTLRTGLLVI